VGHRATRGYDEPAMTCVFLSGFKLVCKRSVRVRGRSYNDTHLAKLRSRNTSLQTLRTQVSKRISRQACLAWLIARMKMAKVCDLRIVHGPSMTTEIRGVYTVHPPTTHHQG
jgi:hypothetical protein